MGLTQKVLIFGCVPIGVWGVVRLLRPFGSQRASLVAGLAYLAMALAYNALALGRWGALVVYAGAPWVLACLSVTGRHPLGPPGTAAGRGRPASGPTPAEPLAAGTGPSGIGASWPWACSRRVLVSFVPAAAIVVLVAAASPSCSRRSSSASGGPAWRAARGWPSGRPWWPRSSASRGSSASCPPAGGPSSSSACPPRPRGRPRGGRCCASPSVPSVARRWPGDSSSPPWCRWCWPAASGSGGPGGSGRSPWSSGRWPGSSGGGGPGPWPSTRWSCWPRPRWPSPPPSDWASPPSRRTCGPPTSVGAS